MNLSFFACIYESEDPAFIPSTFVEVNKKMYLGEKLHVETDSGGYDLVGLDAITYEDEADLKQQVNAILKELDA